ncbi:MAG TPA: hypothetical protein VH280_12800 [Verrucomicrobiae bacterium]|nr:hypothetical protein [Verrucomicrobiae bacterium]
MAGSSERVGSLRPGRFEGERVALALAISLMIHTFIWAGYELNRYRHWVPRLSFMVPKQPPRVQTQQSQEPIEFVTVETPSTVEPVNPKYISNKNSVAADDSQKKNSENPKLNGRQIDVPKTTDEIRAALAKAQAAADQRNFSESQDKGESKPAKNAGDMTLGKPDDKTQPEKQPRPRTLKEAYAQMARHIPSITMKQDGGAEKKAIVPSFSVKVTGFGDYDERFAETVQQNWWNILDSRQFAMDRTGKVVLFFRLNYDGSISQLRLGENNVGELLGYVCEKAVLDGAPYERWTEDMRLKLGEYIDVEYTFDYD